LDGAISDIAVGVRAAVRVQQQPGIDRVHAGFLEQLAPGRCHRVLATESGSGGKLCAGLRVIEDE
jgi:hypothetical protein